MRAAKYINQILTNIKGKIDSNTIILEDFNIPSTTMDRSYIKSTRKHKP